MILTFKASRYIIPCIIHSHSMTRHFTVKWYAAAFAIVNVKKSCRATTPPLMDVHQVLPAQQVPKKRTVENYPFLDESSGSTLGGAVFKRFSLLHTPLPPVT